MREMVAAELMKVRTRWLPYLLLFFMIAGAAVQVLLFGLVSYYDERNSDEYGPYPPGYFTFVSRWSFRAVLDSGQFWGGVFIAFLVASAIATEYNWGTVRTAVARGQTRTQYLAAKLIALASFSALLLLTAFAFGIAFSFIGTALAGEPALSGVPGEPTWGELPLMILRAGLGILPYAMLAFCLTVIGRSTALGATGTLIYKLIEMIVLPIFNELGGIWADLRVFFFGHHADALIAANRGSGVEYYSIAFRNVPEAGNVPDPWIAAFVLIGWSVVLAAIAFMVFDRRDLNSRNE